MNNKLICLLPMLIALLIFPFVMLMAFPVNMTDSMPKGIYVRLPAIGRLEPGDLVQVESPMAHGYLGTNENGNLLKRIVSITEDGLYEVQGDTPLSYDSTFFGLIGREYIKARIIPLITETRGSKSPSDREFS